MSSKQDYVKLFNAKFPNYDLQTSITSKRPADPTNPAKGFNFEATSKITIFAYAEEKKAFTERIVTGMAEAGSVSAAEDAAILRAMEHLGLEVSNG